MADPDLSESSLGSWADECERANPALAAAKDQMGRTGEGHETDASLAAAEARMEKEDREWLAALEAAMALLHPRQQGPENQPPNKGRAAPAAAAEWRPRDQGRNPSCKAGRSSSGGIHH